jgi:hypothetical protein
METSPEDQFAEVLIERQQDPRLAGAKIGDLFVRGARAILRYRPDIVSGVSQSEKGRARKVLVRQKPHAVESG